MADEPAGALSLDAVLVGRILDGETAAFDELFFRYHTLVYGLAWRILNDAAEAEDICQRVFLKVHEQLSTLRQPERLRSWLCRITLNLAYNAERSFRRRFRTLTISLDACADAPPTSAPADDPERALVAAETRRRLDDALAALPFAYRTVVILRDIEGLSYDEIAEALNANIGTVKSRLARGREALRAQLRDLLNWHLEAGA